MKLTNGFEKVLSNPGAHNAYDLCVNDRIKVMYNHVDKRSNIPSPLIADSVYAIVMEVFNSLSFSSFTQKKDIYFRLIPWHIFPCNRMPLASTVKSFTTETSTMITLGSKPLKDPTC